MGPHSVYEQRMRRFREIAEREGYTVKIVGALAYRKPRRRGGCTEIIKLLSLRDEVPTVVRTHTTGGY